MVQECRSTCISGGVCASVMCILVRVCAYMNVCSTKVKSASFGKKHRTLDIFRTKLLVALLFSHTKGIVGLFASEQHPDRLRGPWECTTNIPDPPSPRSRWDTQQAAAPASVPAGVEVQLWPRATWLQEDIWVPLDVPFRLSVGNDTCQLSGVCLWRLARVVGRHTDLGVSKTWSQTPASPLTH